MTTTIAQAREELTAAGVRYTRRDFMEKRVSYSEYEAQFATDAVIWLVKQVIGTDRILASTDPYFNDIPLREWDAACGVVWPTWSSMGDKLPNRPHVASGRLIALSNMFTQDPATAVPSISLSDCVGALKAAARKIRGDQ